MKRRGVQAAVVVLILAMLTAAGTVWRLEHPAAGTSAAAAPAVAVVRPDLAPPPGTRVRVEVLNGTTTRGLARRATAVLRDHGFDVVETGTDVVARDTTIVYDVSGHADWAARIAALFSPARVVARPDTSRYLDVTVSIGTTWRAPAQPFYP